MAVSYSGTQRVLCFTNVFPFIIREYLYHCQCALLSLEIHINLEVSAWFDWLRVEVPCDRGSWITTELYVEYHFISIIHTLVSQWDCESRRLLK